MDVRKRISTFAKTKTLKNESYIIRQTMGNGTKFVTMGEIMLRMTRPDYQRIIQGSKIDGFFGGSEANVAISLAQMGDDVEYVTRLPNNMLGVACRNELRRFNVGTKHIIWGGTRLGKYFYEQVVSTGWGAYEYKNKTAHDCRYRSYRYRCSVCRCHGKTQEELERKRRRWVKLSLK